MFRESSHDFYGPELNERIASQRALGLGAILLLFLLQVKEKYSFRAFPARHSPEATLSEQDGAIWS